MSNPQEKITYPSGQGEAVAPLALGRRAAADTLGISTRKLDELTANRTSGIPVARIGSRVLYPVAELREWLAEQVQRKGGNRR